MNNAHLVAACIGVTLALTIIMLVRGDRMSPKVAARWFCVSLLVLLVSLTPEIVDWLGLTLGIAYPPILPVLFAIAVITVKILIMDIERQKIQTKIDRLVQKISIIEAMAENKAKSEENSNEDNIISFGEDRKRKNHTL